MKTLLLTIAGLGLAMSSVQACPYQKSVKAEPVDQTVVASVATATQSDPVAVPVKDEAAKVDTDSQ